MPSPASVGGFPYYPVEFTKDGVVARQDEVAAVLNALAPAADAPLFTDLVVISHGWNNDIPEAEQLYAAIFSAVQQVLPLANPACDAVRARRVAVLGVHWPSKKFDDASLIPGGAAAMPGGDDGTAAAAAIDRLAALIDTPDSAQALARARTLVAGLADSVDARDEFVRIVRAFMPHGANDEEPVIPNDLYTLDGDELLRRMSRPARDGASSMGGAAGLGAWFGKVADGARNLANLVTYYQMKARAGAIGQGGVYDMLRRIRQERPADGPSPLRLHLIGHSFGARLVTAAAAGPVGAPPLPVDSLVLLQAAFSHYGFAMSYDGTHDGFFRRVLTDPGRVRGPLAITFTSNDKAVGLAYPIASRIARQIAAALGDAKDPYGGLGRNGAQKTPGAQTVTLAAPGTAYGFAPRGIYNLDGNAVIGGHSDLAHAEIGYAIVSAMATMS